MNRLVAKEQAVVRQVELIERVVRLDWIDWERLHFCRENKVRYRKLLTIMMMVATLLSLVGAGVGLVWLCHLGTLMNAWTAILWIWE